MIIKLKQVKAPEEMVHATGYLPMGIWGAQGKQISKARTYLPAFACSIMQQIMELQCEGAYDDLAAVLFSVPCDTLKCLSQKWKGANADKVIVFTHPQNRGLEAANQLTWALRLQTQLWKTPLLSTTKTEQLCVNSLK